MVKIRTKIYIFHAILFKNNAKRSSFDNAGHAKAYSSCQGVEIFALFLNRKRRGKFLYLDFQST